MKKKREIFFLFLVENEFAFSTKRKLELLPWLRIHQVQYCTSWWQVSVIVLPSSSHDKKCSEYKARLTTYARHVLLNAIIRHGCQGLCSRYALCNFVPSNLFPKLLQNDIKILDPIKQLVWKKVLVQIKEA